MIWVTVAAVVLAVVAGFVFGWQWVLGPVLGIAVWTAASAVLRSLATTGGEELAEADEDGLDGPVDTSELTESGDVGGGDAPAATADPSGKRIVYRCEACGSELLSLVRGSGSPPRHCGRRMEQRTEVPN